MGFLVCLVVVWGGLVGWLVVLILDCNITEVKQTEDSFNVSLWKKIQRCKTGFPFNYFYSKLHIPFLGSPLKETTWH